METRDVRLETYWPPVISQMRDFQQIATGENPEFKTGWGAVTRFLEDCFVQTATEYALERYERIYSVTAFPGDTLEQRRARILAQMTKNVPYTMRALRNMLATILGAGNFTATVNPILSKLSVKISINKTSQMNDVHALLDAVVPANIEVDLNYLFTTHEMLTAYTHEQLAAYTHQEIKEKLVTT